MADPHFPDRSVRRSVLWFAVSGFTALAVLAVGSFLIAERVATAEALRTSAALAETMARTSIEPYLADSDLRRSVGLSDLDALVRDRLLVDPVVSVRLWSDDGTIAYASDTAMIGQQFPLSEEQRRVLADGGVHAEVDELQDAENADQDSGYTSLLEVYLPVEDGRGNRYLFEIYTRQTAVAEAASRLMSGFAPIILGSLLVLAGILLALAWSLARRLQRESAERERLLNQALDASDLERRRIAADLHDGVVQDLAGVTYGLAALQQRAEDPVTRDQLDRTAATTQAAVRSLRTLLVDIYPTSLTDAGLRAALTDQLARLPGSVTSSLDLAAIEAGPALSDTTQAVLYRAAREALHNVAKHAAAGRVDVRIEPGPTATGARLTVTDDGTGFDPATVPADHLGLRLLTDLAAAAGGSCVVHSAPGQGTTVRFEVP